ncbi:HNH endonuclease [Parashewanella curva]|uniref:HNH endonuclease n=1 Tax=Parashewanella curva TaxID=2338552 RepID=UPI00140498A3|nr:HNH endonuclease [Parashewanella curva]
MISNIDKAEEFRVKNRKGNGMYSAALNSYKAFLLDITQAEVQQDIDLIIRDNEMSETQKSLMVNTRIGQGRFREDLIQYWDGCAVTGYQNNDFLIASHIKPWSKSDNAERHDPFNGLLLLANIDKAFDLGYISFESTGKILISEQLDEYQALGINDHMKVALSKQHKDYLAFHRECQFKN